MPSSRRDFLRSAAMASSAALPAGAVEDAPLPTVKLKDCTVTRLICGSNPFYGFSHFNRLLDQHMREWMTPDRIQQVLQSAERQGINTWQTHCSDRALADIRRYLEEGGCMQWLILGDGALGDRPAEMIPQVAKMGPIAIVHHGNRTDDRFREGKHELVHDFLKRVRDSGVLVGLSTHNPAVIDYVEGKNWDVDFYMTCFYYITRPREDALKTMAGERPVGEPFLEKDPERMCKMIRQTRKTCFAFKILAAGRVINSQEGVERAYRFAFSNIKPQDCAIVGMYPRYKDEVAENVALARRYGAAPLKSTTTG